MLEAIFHDLNKCHFDGVLPLPRLSWNTRLSTTAGRFSPRGWPKLRAARSEALIEVAGYLRDLSDGDMHIRDTILHEMIHYWLWIRRRSYGHTSEFYAKMHATGAKRWNPVPRQRPPRYIYACRSCDTEVPARRRQSADIACYRCCKRYNSGHFHPKFRLYLKADLREIAAATTAPKGASLDKKERILPFNEVVQRLQSLREIVQSKKPRF